jgi:osmotically-inducible protein OsmY
VESDRKLRDAVMRELKWDPAVNAARIAVTARNGAVTLSGHVSSYAEEMAAVAAAERVRGVKAVADELEVHIPISDVRDDTDLAQEIARTLRWSILVPDTVEAEVRDGHVTLRGEVRWAFQRRAAERAIRSLRGIRGVTNEIAVRPRGKPDPARVKEQIVEAIERSAALDARSIWIATADGTVHLHGQVHSLWEKHVAEEAAAAAPGVARVENHIVVTP